MPFQWLQMRITEEKERREREAQILERLPRALEEFEANLEQCVADYAAAFGNDRVTLTRDDLRLSVTSDNARVEIIADTELPGFRIERSEGAMAVQVGVLAGDRLFYLDKESDQYLSMEDLTRRALDRVLFPKLKD